MEKYIVIDTETTNSIDDPICYDVGWAVVDENGEIYDSFSFVVADVFLDSEIMDSAYYKDKIPQYWNEIKNGKRKLAKFKTILKIFKESVRKHGVKQVFAHNARFDYRSLNLTQRYLTNSKYRFFFPFGIEICDTLKMARQALKFNTDYDNFCWDNNYLTARGCKRFTAEILFRFLSGNNGFEESHTGLEDVLIEKEILKFCLNCGFEVERRLWAD